MTKRLRLKKYLLGKGSSAETDEIELQILSDPNIDILLSSAEDELIEDYIATKLSEEDKLCFQKNFLVSEKRKERLQYLALLKQELLSQPEKKRSYFANIASLIDVLKKRRILQLASAIIIFGIVLLPISYYLITDENNSIQSVVDSVDQKEGKFLSKYPTESIINLSPSMFRNNQESTEIKNPESKQVIFRLMLSRELEEEKRFKITFFEDGKQIFTLNKDEKYENQIGKELRVLIPSSILDKKKLYRIQLESLDSITRQDMSDEYIFEFN